jgi:hypothetical protein
MAGSGHDIGLPLTSFCSAQSKAIGNQQTWMLDFEVLKLVYKAT